MTDSRTYVQISNQYFLPNSLSFVPISNSSLNRTHLVIMFYHILFPALFFTIALAAPATTPDIGCDSASPEGCPSNLFDTSTSDNRNDYLLSEAQNSDSTLVSQAKPRYSRIASLGCGSTPPRDCQICHLSQQTICEAASNTEDRGICATNRPPFASLCVDKSSGWYGPTNTLGTIPKHHGDLKGYCPPLDGQCSICTTINELFDCENASFQKYLDQSSKLCVTFRIHDCIEYDFSPKFTGP